MTLIPYLKRYRWHFLAGFLFIFLQNYGISKIPEYFRKILDELTAANRTEMILLYVKNIFLFTAFTGIMMFGMRYLVIGGSRKIEYLMRQHLFRKLMEVDMHFYLKHQTGDLISRCTNDLSDVRTLLGPGMLYIPNALSRFVMFLPILFHLNTRLMLIITGLIILLISLIVILLPLLRPMYLQVQQQIGLLNNFVWESIAGITTIKIYTAEPQQKVNFTHLNEEYIRRQLRLAKWRGFLWPFFIFILSLAELFILYFGGKSVMDGTMTIGELLQFNVMLGYLTFPILSMGWIFSLLQQGISALQRINEIFHYRNPDRTLKLENDGSIDVIRLNNFTYTYPDTAIPVLRDILLEIPLRQKMMIGITGEIGSGKSTLIQLIADLIPVPPSSIFYGKLDLSEIDENTVYPLISMVLQQPYLFSRSVKENIALARQDEVDEKEIAKVIEMAGLKEEVESFPSGEDQLIGERGIMLSGGQKQRLAIARALYKRAKILILDDALSSVDARTEEKILTHLRELDKFPLIIFVSHRISALKNADLILVMKNKTIIERGRHEDLVRLDGYYARLAKLQQLTLEEEWE